MQRIVTLTLTLLLFAVGSAVAAPPSFVGDIKGGEAAWEKVEAITDMPQKAEAKMELLRPVWQSYVKTVLKDGFSADGLTPSRLYHVVSELSASVYYSAKPDQSLIEQGRADLDAISKATGEALLLHRANWCYLAGRRHLDGARNVSLAIDTIKAYEAAGTWDGTVGSMAYKLSDDDPTGVIVDAFIRHTAADQPSMAGLVHYVLPYARAHGVSEEKLKSYAVTYFQHIKTPEVSPHFAEMLIPATSPAAFLVYDKPDALIAALSDSGKVGGLELLQIRKQLVDGGDYRLLNPTDAERAIAADLNDAVLADYWVPLFEGRYADAASVALGRMLGSVGNDAEYKRWATHGLAPVVRMMYQSYNEPVVKVMEELSKPSPDLDYITKVLTHGE